MTAEDPQAEAVDIDEDLHRLHRETLSASKTTAYATDETGTNTGDCGGRWAGSNRSNHAIHGSGNQFGQNVAQQP